MSDIALRSISILQDSINQSLDGVSYSSDQVTYPAGMERLPDDVYERSSGALWLYKNGQFYEDDDIRFWMRGYFREYDEMVLDHDADDVYPIMANVDIYLQHVSKSGLTKAEVTFKAEDTPHGSASDPRIRFRCEGHYDAAGGGDTRFSAVVEINCRAEVNVVGSDIVGGDGEISDDSPNGFIVKFPFGI